MSSGFYQGIKMSPGTICVLVASYDCLFFNENTNQFQTDIDCLNLKIKSSGNAHIMRL